MKSFSKSTILGLTIGILLAGYAVFAFDPPAQAPPGGNIPAPINLGEGDQTKEGLLQLANGLAVSGGLRIGNYSTASRPDCTLTTRGTILFDTNTGQPHVCDGSSWRGYAGLTGSTGSSGPVGSSGSQGLVGPQGPQGTPGPTVPEQGGLFGSCTYWDNQSGYNQFDGCKSSVSPCSGCSCPGGYTRVVTRHQDKTDLDCSGCNDYGAWTWYSCYKN